ncbi:phosphoribosylformylglycinamidine synthase subunit PurQ [Desulfococcus sp.]|uniref:phosphoribosylformylglycinamidine synthase subunit PurQ n=1 Tax=Desulfococcus sp. TaxID=2025834 RepID=UPI0035939A12
MNRDVNVLVLTGYGLNCDHETAYAFERAGAGVRRVHINSLIDGSDRLDGVQILVFIGGFSWGDDHGAGVIQAVRLKNTVGEAILDFIGRGNLVLGICNGFQTLVNLGLLPGIDGDYQRRSVALTHNDCGNFRDDWVHLRVNPASPCVFTRGMERLYLPVRHGEGKFFADGPILERLIRDHQVVMQYATPDGEPAGGRFPDNPNGAMADIAGICDPTGRVFGLMPHPEAYNHVTNHPGWTRDKALHEKYRRDPPPGVQLLKNAVDFVRKG